jgi:hypothetical protein
MGNVTRRGGLVVMWSLFETVGEVSLPSLRSYVTPETWMWCLLPYPGHSKGCPNFGEKIGCPPQVSLLSPKFFESWTLLVFPFNMAEQTKRMHTRNPQGTERQWRCCLYWQGSFERFTGARGRFKRQVHTLGYKRVIWCPEAHGLDLNSLCEDLGMRLEWPPWNVVRLLALGRKP